MWEEQKNICGQDGSSTRPSACAACSAARAANTVIPTKVQQNTVSPTKVQQNSQPNEGATRHSQPNEGATKGGVWLGPLHLATHSLFQLFFYLSFH